MYTFQQIFDNWMFGNDGKYFNMFQVTERLGYNIDVVTENIYNMFLPSRNLASNETVTETELPNGSTRHKGLVYISDHPFDLDKWSASNSKYEFYISFVMGDETLEWCRDTIKHVPNRNITIYITVTKVDERQISFLSQMIGRILEIDEAEISKVLKHRDANETTEHHSLLNMFRNVISYIMDRFRK